MLLKMHTNDRWQFFNNIAASHGKSSISVDVHFSNINFSNSVTELLLFFSEFAVHPHHVLWIKMH